MRSVTVGAMWGAMILILAGCDPYPGSPPVVNPPATPETSTPPVERPVMAMVNGRPIYMDQLHHHLVASFGTTFASYLIDFEIVQQAAQAEDVQLTDADVADELERSLAHMSIETTDPAEREQLLTQALKESGMTREQFDIWLKGRALLRQLAEANAEVTEQDVRDEFDRQFGRQVLIRTIQLPSLAGIEQVRELLVDGEDFAELARKYSDHPSSSDGGLLAPISPRSVHVAIPLRDVAVTLTEVGQVSNPIRVGDAYHILQLVKVYESQEEDFQAVEAQLRLDVRERKILYLQESILLELRRQAEVRLIDRTLREQAASGG